MQLVAEILIRKRLKLNNNKNYFCTSKKYFYFLTILPSSNTIGSSSNSSTIALISARLFTLLDKSIFNILPFHHFIPNDNESSNFWRYSFKRPSSISLVHLPQIIVQEKMTKGVHFSCSFYENQILGWCFLPSLFTNKLTLASYGRKTGPNFFII